MREAFLLQMNDFDLILELNLRQMLDPVVARKPPVRGGRLARPQAPILALEPAGLELAPQAIAVLDSVAVTIPVSPAGPH